MTDADVSRIVAAAPPTLMPTAVAAPSPTATRKRRNPALTATALVIFAVAIVVIARPTKPTPAGGTQGNPLVPAAPVTLLDLGGNGIKSSQPFTASDSWTLAYTFDCTSFGFSGNFQVYVYEGESLRQIAVNELGKQGSSSTTVYATGGLHLQMNSECSWHVRVTQP
jgi:hypothetical protein